MLNLRSKKEVPMLTITLMSFAMTTVLVHLAARGLHSTTELSMQRHER